MRNLKYYIDFFCIPILLTAFAGCSKKNADPVFSEFNKVVNLNSTNTKIESADLGEVVDMLISLSMTFCTKCQIVRLPTLKRLII